MVVRGDSGSRGSCGGIEAGRLRRKVRKGTRSCWECKRNKTKCNLASTLDAICGGCKRRGVQCLSQEFYTKPPVQKRQFDDQVGGIERLGDVGAGRSCQETFRNLPKADIRSAPYVCRQHLILQPQPGNVELINALLSAWPKPADLESLLEAPIQNIAVCHGLICLPWKDTLERGVSTPRKLLCLPPVEAHPVLHALKLLTLATFLQSLPSSFHQHRNNVLNVKDIEEKSLNAAVRLVASSDELILSVEGIELLMMESMYHNNGGNLRKAYLVMRRALSVAQLLGLDRDISTHSTTFIDESTKSRINPSVMWFRIVQSDNYLSLMLGLPAGSDQISFTSSEIIRPLMDIERLEQSITAASARIMKRDRQPDYDCQETQAIDQLLLDAAQQMPTRWWLPPDLSQDTTCNGADSLLETTRMMDQLAYFYGLSRVHLPFLLRPAPAGEYDYNRVTCLTANREILSRFVSFRAVQIRTGCFCRGVDLLAFMASLTICLFHIQGSFIRNNSHGERYDTYAFSYLCHQRPTDRAVVERVLELMLEVASADPSDTIANSVIETLEHILRIEAEAREGILYQTDSTDERGDHNASTVDNFPIDLQDALRIRIPHFGTVKVSRVRSTVNNSTSMGTGDVESFTNTGNNIDAPQALSADDAAGWLSADWESTHEWEWSLQGVNQALFSSIFSPAMETFL